MGSESCTWASDVQQTLTEYTYSDPVVFVEFGPKETSDIYFPFSSGANSKDALKIREEIKVYNELKCPVRQLSATARQQSKSSTICERAPANFCQSFPESPKGLVDELIAIRTVALASECIVPALVRSRSIQEKLAFKVKSDSRSRHLRWLYFLVFSLVAGGKIANASTKLASLDARPIEERRRLLKFANRMLSRVIVIGSSITRSVHYLRDRYLSGES